MNNVVSPLSSWFHHCSESICFKVEYLKGLDFHTRFDLFRSTFQQLFEVRGHSECGH